jgi:hypothetical protein
MTIERLKHFTKQQMSFDDAGQPPITPPTPSPGESSSTPAGPQVPQEDRWYVNASGFLQGTATNPQKDLGIAPIKGEKGGMYIDKRLISVEQHERLEQYKLNTFSDSQSINVDDGIDELSRYIESNGEFPDLATFFKDKNKWGSFVGKLKEAITYHKPIELEEGMEDHPAFDIKRAKGDDKFTNNFNIREMNVGLPYVLLESLGKHLGYNSDDFRDTIEQLGIYVGTDVDSDDIEGSFLNESNWWQEGNNDIAAKELQSMVRPFTGVDHSLTDYDTFMKYVEDSSNAPKLNFKYVTPASVYGVIARSRGIGETGELYGQKKEWISSTSAARQGLQYQDMMNHISEKFKIPKYYSYGNNFTYPAVDENNNDIYMSRQDAQEFVDGYEAWEKDNNKANIILSDSKDKINFNEINKKTVQLDDEKENALTNMYARQKHFLSQEAHHTMSDEELKNTSFGKGFKVKNRKPEKIKDVRPIEPKEVAAQENLFKESLDDFSGAKGHNALVGLDISYGLSHLLSTDQEKHDEIVEKLTNNALGEEGLFRDVKEKGDLEKKLNLVNNLNKKLWARLSEDDQKTLKQSAKGFRDTLLNHQFKTNEQFLNLVAPETDYVPIYRGTKDILEGLRSKLSKVAYEQADKDVNQETLEKLRIAIQDKIGPRIRQRGTDEYVKGINIKPHSTILTGGSQDPSGAVLTFAGPKTETVTGSGNVIVSKVPKSDFFHLPSLSIATRMPSEHEAIYVNRPTTQAKLVSRSRLEYGGDFEKHPLGLIPKQIREDFDSSETITKGETIMKEDKEPLEIIIPNFNENSSDEDVKEELKSYLAAIRTKKNLFQKIKKENSNS